MVFPCPPPLLWTYNGPITVHSLDLRKEAKLQNASAQQPQLCPSNPEQSLLHCGRTHQDTTIPPSLTAPSLKDYPGCVTTFIIIVTLEDLIKAQLQEMWKVCLVSGLHPYFKAYLIPPPQQIPPTSLFHNRCPPALLLHQELRNAKMRGNFRSQMYEKNIFGYYGNEVNWFIV